jgi:hypothetical protein
VGPVRRSAWKSPEGAWAGKVTIADDAPEADTSGLWEVLRQRKGAPPLLLDTYIEVRWLAAFKFRCDEASET